MITAIRDKKRQRAVVVFPAPFSIFTNEDIAVNGGIEFSELLNSEENLCMGRAVQSNVNVTLINSDKLLSSVDFTQEFTVALGVETADGETAVRNDATLAVKVGDHVITASSNQVYFDSTAYSVNGTPAALFVYENTLFVIGDTGAVINTFAIEDAGNGGSAITGMAVTGNAIVGKTTGSVIAATSLPEWNTFMLGKAAQWAANGTCLSYVDGVMHECAVSAGVMAYRTSQFAPLGHFVGSKPDKVKTQIVSLSGDDLMQRFEVPAYEYFDTLTYPATLGALFNKLCEYCEVEVGDVSAALNMDKSFDAAPIDNDTSTCREVLAYIAEAAGCYARISRDGKCELVWFADVDYTLNKTDYFSIDMAEYTVQQINKLQSHVTQDDIGVIVGEGTNCYDILDNPYLNGSTDAEMRPWVENIYNRLAAFPEYSPITVNCESYWLLRCGDIITVETDEGDKQLPIFAQTISWAGNARASIQSTGEQTRGVMTATNREKLVNGRHYAEISKSIEGVSVKVNSVESAANAAQFAASANASDITKLTERVNTAEQKITADAIVSTVRSSSAYTSDLTNTKSGAVSEANANTDEKLKSYSTTTEMNSAITQKADAISFEVSKKVTQSEVDASIDAIDEFHSTSVDITADGVAIKTGGRFTVESEKFDIDENGEMSATNARISGQLSVDGNDVWHKGILIVSTATPSNPTEGTIWVKPDMTDIPAAGTWSHAALTSRPWTNPYNVALSGTSIGAAPSNATYTYTVSVPVFHTWDSDEACTCKVYLGASSGAETIAMGTQTFSDGGNHTFTASVTSTTWLGNSGTIYLRVKFSDGNLMSVNSHSVMSCTLTAKSTSATGWKPCAVQMYVG